MRRRMRTLAAALIAAGTLMASASHVAAAPAPADEFFIVSSIDTAKHQLLLKRPTEVTDVMRVDAGTRLVDESGKAITLADLRAGDTVFIRSKPGQGGAVALEIRKGPMTIPELARRYLHK